MRKNNCLDTPLLDLGSGVYVSYRDLTQHILVTGAMNSGKSPAPARIDQFMAEKLGWDRPQTVGRIQTQERGIKR